ncbi:MAG: metal ABC transporter permease [Desulfatibacillaceae bacterium]
MLEALSHEFMQNAVLAGLLASVICGTIGAFVVVNRMVFLSGGIAHAAYGGIGLAFFLGLPYMLGTILFTLVAAGAMAAATWSRGHHQDTVVGAIWAVGMAIGIILLDLTPGYNVDLMSYLFGSILAVPRADLWIMAGLGAVVLAVVAVFYNGLQAMSFDPEFARLRGVRTGLLYMALVAMVCVAVVMVIRVVGIILVIALLSIPPAIAEKYTRDLKGMCVISTVLCCAFTLAGLALSYAFDVTSGATIILVAGASFLFSMLLDRVFPRLSVASRTARLIEGHGREEK